MNTPTVIVLICLAAVIGVVIGIMVKNKRSGKHSCGCSCENCPIRNKCDKE